MKIKQVAIMFIMKVKNQKVGYKNIKNKVTKYLLNI